LLASCRESFGAAIGSEYIVKDRHRQTSPASALPDAIPHALVCAASLLIAVLIAACSAFQETPAQKAQRVEPVLSAAGFRVVPADSVKRQQVFSGLPPLKSITTSPKTASRATGSPILMYATAFMKEARRHISIIRT